MTPLYPFTRAVLAALLFLIPGAADAQRDGDSIDTTVVIARDGSVHLGLISGEIRVTGADRRDVRISASIERGRFEAIYTASRVSITARTAGGRMSGGRYDIVVPHGTRVTATSISGDIDIRGTRGEVTARSTSGEITIQEAVTRIEATTVSGDLSLMDVDGRIRLEAVSGDVHVDNGRGEVSVETVSGSVTLRRSRLDGIRASAVSGSIGYDGPLATNGSYRLNAHSGSVTLTLPANVGASLELETFSGRITSDFPLTLQPGERTGRRNRRMEFNLGNGSARLVVGSFSGNITIRRSGAAGNRE